MIRIRDYCVLIIHDKLHVDRFMMFIPGSVDDTILGLAMSSSFLFGSSGRMYGIRGGLAQLTPASVYGLSSWLRRTSCYLCTNTLS